VIGDRTVVTVKDKLSYTIVPGVVDVAVVPAWVDVTTLVLSTLVVSVSALLASVVEEVAGSGAELPKTVLDAAPVPELDAVKGAALDVSTAALQKSVN
jgi:hypothetical protein